MDKNAWLLSYGKGSRRDARARGTVVVMGVDDGLVNLMGCGDQTTS